MTPPAPDAHGAAGRVRIFGGVLATDRSLPGLPDSRDSSDDRLTLRNLRTVDALSDTIAHSADAELRGRMEYASGVSISMAMRGGEIEVLVSDTGRFTLSSDGREIEHLAPRNVDRGAVALDLIGVVLPMALHRDGAWCVHASAVESASGVIAFVAERGTGKSTLAAACVQAGAALVADDVLVLRESENGISVTPAGVPLRLRESTARAVGLASDDADDCGKVRVTGPRAHDSLPLDAIYVLQATGADSALARALRGTRAAALALLANGKITALLGTDPIGEALTRCVALAHRTTVYDLAVPRDLDRLGSVAHDVLRWHALAPTGGATG